ncbi:MAG: hypothetical protein ABI675_19790 [Chitinophagaceae bacterium]
MRFLQLFFVLIPCYCFSQADSILEYSRLEKMVMQPGSFVNISSRTLGEAGNLAIGTITATDLTDGKKQRSVCFIATNSFSNVAFSYTNTQVDIEDLQTFVNALKKMKEVVDSKKMTDLQTYQYTASNMTVASLENRLGNQSKWDLSIYKRYKYINVIIPGTALYVKGKDINALVNILNHYLNSLNGNLYD